MLGGFHGDLAIGVGGKAQKGFDGQAGLTPINVVAGLGVGVAGVVGQGVVHAQRAHGILVDHFGGDGIANAVVTEFAHHGGGVVFAHLHSRCPRLKGLTLKDLVVGQGQASIAGGRAIDKPNRHIGATQLRPVGDFAPKDGGKVAKGQIALKRVVATYDNGNFLPRHRHRGQGRVFLGGAQRPPQGRQINGARHQRLERLFVATGRDHHAGTGVALLKAFLQALVDARHGRRPVNGDRGVGGDAVLQRKRRWGLRRSLGQQPRLRSQRLYRHCSQGADEGQHSQRRLTTRIHGGTQGAIEDLLKDTR